MTQPSTTKAWRALVIAAGMAVARAVTTCLAFVPALGQAQFPSAPPPAAAIRPASFPAVRETTLPNGMRLVVVHSARQPVVALSLAFPAGSAYDPPGKAGLSDMMATLLTRGAGARAAEAFAADIEGVGGQISATATADFVTLRADVLSDAAPLAFAMLADAARRPTFPETEVELLRTQLLSALTLELSQPASVADRAMARGLFGEHPYARRADPASMKSLSRADLVAFHQARLRPSGALFVVAGNLTFEQARALVMRNFGSWTGTAASPLPAVAFPSRSGREIVLVHRPGSVQSNIVVANLTWSPSDPRAYGAAIANRLLGGGADSRLFLTLREQRSWTYGARSALVPRRAIGTFEASTEVRSEVTDSALVELLAQLDRMGRERIPGDEFDRTRNAMTGAFPLTVETAKQLAAEIANARLLGQPVDYVQRYRQRLASVTAADAQRAARAAIRPADALIVVVGDARKIQNRLAAIAPVRVIAVDGTPLRAEELEVKAAALDLDLAQLVPRTDSFTILVQGRPFGFQRTTLERAPEGWVFRDETRLATLIQQSTVVRFSSSLALQSVEQSGRTQGQDTKISVTYGNGRATGSATTPQQGSVKTVAVDAELPAGAIDDNMLTAVLPALKWSAGARFAVTVFQSGKGSATTLNIAVAGEEQVQVIAGTFVAWKAEITGGDAPIRVWIERGGAHRLLKLALTGQPIEFQLAK